MKWIAITSFLLSAPVFALSIKGRVNVDQSCRAGKAMVWLAMNNSEFAKKELLLHTAVPERGTFEFYVKPGSYLVTVSNENGCAWEKPVDVRDNDVFIDTELKEKK